jgi:hypothetical protein
MAPIVHIIDPDPDTIIVLKNPCTIFAPWEPEVDQRKSEVPGDPKLPVNPWGLWDASGSALPKKKSGKKKAKKAAVKRDDIGSSTTLSSYKHRYEPSPSPPSPLSPPSLRHPPESAETPEDFTKYTMDDWATALAEPSSAVQRTPSLPAQKDPEEPEEPEEESIHYHVSSRHLMLSSPIFKRMLTQNGFAESVRNELDGLFHIPALYWDAEAFLIVLQIVHGRNKQVPREVTLEMLAKIAVLEDYYYFGEALDVFTEVWIQKLVMSPIPTVYDRDLVLWIWIAWVFDIEEQFKEATFTAIMQSTESLRTLDLPIPTIVSGTRVCDLPTTT